MHLEAARLRLKTRTFTALVVLSNVCGNFFLTWGLRQDGRLLSFSPWPYIRALFNPWVALGASLLIVWLFTHMALLSWAELMFVLPVTSIGYGMPALVGRFCMHEDITQWRWASIGLIVLGVTQ